MTESDTSAADRQLLAEPSRQSPLALVFIAWRFFRQFQTIGIGAVFLLFTGRLSGPLLGAAIALACIALAVSVLAWWRYVFCIDGDELIVTKGVVAVERLSIPFNRVQSASIEQKFLHRPVGLVSVAIDTAGSSEAEFEIDAVPRAKAEALQRLVSISQGSRQGQTDSFNDGSSPAAIAADVRADGPVVKATESEVIIHRGWRELVRIGLAKWPWTGLVAFVPLLTVADDLFDYVDIEFSTDDVPIEPNFSFQFFLSTLGALVGVTVLGAILQVARQFLSNWDLKLLRTGDGLRRTAGLLNKTSRASSLTRIQSLKVHQSVLQRIFRIRKVQLSTIGDGDLQIPGAVPHELAGLRQLVFGSADPPALDQAVSPIMIIREVRIMALLVLAAMVAIVVIGASPWFWFVAVLLPIQLAASYWKWSKRRWSYSPSKMAELHRFFDTDSTEIEPFKAQTVEVEQSIFERRRGLATITVRLAEGRLSVPLIDESQARQIRDSILYQAESDPRAWM